MLSDAYRKQQEELHAKGNYGVTAQKYGALVSNLIDALEIDTVLDYGCGSNLSLRETLKPKRSIKYQAYDPGVPEYAGDPEASEMVVCVDVLEHIEPAFLDDVLDHLMEMTQVVLFASIHTGPAGKTLSDGRNAHLIQQPMEWWLPRIWERFHITRFQQTSPNEFYVFANALNLDIAVKGEKKSILASPIIKGT